MRIELRGERLGTAWDGVTEAVSGSHVLTGFATVPAVTRPWAKSRQPRTLLGVDEQGRAFVAVVDGRREGSRGASIKDSFELARKVTGARWALNLDGGGSSTLLFRGRLANRPSDGLPRAVAVGFGASEGK